jgi:spore maturation protein A
MLSYIFLFMGALSLVFSLVEGRGPQLSGAVATGAQAGITLAISLAGSICLWTGVGNLMERAGIARAVSRILRPLLHWIFPQTREDTKLSGHLSANICANLLGLGNAATPMGILAAKDLARGSPVANDQLCRLIVLNTASIQLIPANVAALRASLGSSSPFGILPAVWITSFCSAALGLAMAWLLGKLWPNG